MTMQTISVRYLWRKRHSQLLGAMAVLIWSSAVAAVLALWDFSHEAAMAGLAVLWLMGLGGIALGVRRVAVQVAKRARANARILYLANHDALTRLPNRHLFFDRLKRALEQAGRDGVRTALLLIDLDGFKAVNDLLGPEAGDQALREVARRLTATVREEDMVARIGGDEFAVLMGDLSDVHPVARVANEILKVIAMPIELPDDYLLIEGSMGIAFFPDDADRPEDLVRAADTAMREVKRLEKAGFNFAGAGGAVPLQAASQHKERASLYG